VQVRTQDILGTSVTCPDPIAGSIGFRESVSLTGYRSNMDQSRPGTTAEMRPFFFEIAH
jgi:hypothetical protein